MRKAIPCSRCGVAKLHNATADYIIEGSVPLKLKTGGVLTWKCFCGKVGRMERQEWNSLPDLDKSKQEN